MDYHWDDFFADFHTGPLMNSLTYGPSTERRHGATSRDRDVALRNDRQRPHRGSHDLMMFDPFEMMNGMMSDMQNMYKNIGRQMERGISDGEGAMFSSTRVMSLNNVDGGQPKYYEATYSTRQGSGGLRETRKTERNSEAGYDKMAVGRHIYDRGHVITKKRDNRSGQMEEHQDFLNIEEENALDFDNEWNEKARSNFGSRGYGEVGYQDSSRRQYPTQRGVRAIENYDESARSDENDVLAKERVKSEKKKKKDRKQY